jgi:hypothetical protein
VVLSSELFSESDHLSLLSSTTFACDTVGVRFRHDPLLESESHVIHVLFRSVCLNMFNFDKNEIQGHMGMILSSSSLDVEVPFSESWMYSMFRAQVFGRIWNQEYGSAFAQEGHKPEVSDAKEEEVMSDSDTSLALTRETYSTLATEADIREEVSSGTKDSRARSTSIRSKSRMSSDGIDGRDSGKSFQENLSENDSPPCEAKTRQPSSFSGMADLLSIHIRLALVKNIDVTHNISRICSSVVRTHEGGVSAKTHVYSHVIEADVLAPVASGTTAVLPPSHWPSGGPKDSEESVATRCFVLPQVC